MEPATNGESPLDLSKLERAHALLLEALGDRAALNLSARDMTRVTAVLLGAAIGAAQRGQGRATLQKPEQSRTVPAAPLERARKGSARQIAPAGRSADSGA